MNRRIVKVLVSVRDRLEALICRLCQPVNPDTPQSSPDSRVNSSSAHQAGDAHGGDLIKHPPSSPPHSQVHSDGPKLDPNVTTVDNGPRSSSPPFLPPKDHASNPNQVHSSGGVRSSPPPPPLIHSSSPPPHAEAREGVLTHNDPIDKTTITFSPSPSPTEPLGNSTTIIGASLFHGARHLKITDSNFIVNSAQGETNAVNQVMKELFEHSMRDAAYDSSSRDPPPQCHPGTRVQLREKIILWFRDSKREKALLWLEGPAGVGKSAVIQTIAESLAESNSIGATLFFSRLNNRNDPKRVFITVAFQLAARIPDYQTYITKQIALDPSLLEKGMNDQFRIFIVEPFGKKGVGKEEGPWAVLLDGLDECEGVNEQCRIVRLVSDFVLNFPDAPLVWAISSRPEPHITGTFNDEAVASSYWSECMPVDSPQACRDVEHYLDTSFKDMRKPFPHLPKYWPSETQFVKLSRGAQGLFAFARTAVRFMEDSGHANPVSRLNLILSIIDRLDIKVIDDHPFALLDALYTQILSSIPPLVWPITKRILGFVICTQSGRVDNGLSYPLSSSNRTLVKASIILGLESSDIYSSLHKLYSVLDIPDLEDAYDSEVTFLHASFGDYLADRARSKEFYIDYGESVDDVTRRLFQLYLDKPWDTNWGQYEFKLSMTGEEHVFESLREEAEQSVCYMVTGEFRSKRGTGPFESQQHRSECLDALRRLTPFEAWNAPGARNIIAFITDLWDRFREELENTGIFDGVLLQNLEVGHSDYDSNRPSFFPETESKMLVRSSRVLRDYTYELWIYQRLRPEKQVIIYGSVPEERIAFFEGTYGYSDGYFCFQYPLAEYHRNPVTSTGVGYSRGTDDIVPVISVQGDSRTVAQGMKALSERVAEGAAYDSSIRDPPRCHPGTRVQLREKIIKWFCDSKREKALLWLNGPVGVGKSAVIQTVAESLAETNSIGATLFFSRFNGHNNPHCVFVTIAFQLATRIPNYQAYITKTIVLDPSLLEEEMKDQFRIFIAEPFGKKGIGKGEGPWAVLLDGLDECEGVREQCRIVQLVSEFILNFPDAPLVWAIASRPEPHITGTFNDEVVASTSWSEYMPVDSPQARRDVEHYLDASFKDMRKSFPHLPKNLQSESQFLNLTHGALGLFAFARTAVRSTEGLTRYTTWLSLTSSTIERLDAKVIDGHPFAFLDALYTHILSLLPSSEWHVTKQILGFLICTQSGSIENGLSYPLDDRICGHRSPSLVLGLNFYHGSIRELHSVLNMQSRRDMYDYDLVFVDASFRDYLTDPARSGCFYIDRGESVSDVTRCLFRLFLDKPWDTDWKQYTHQLSILSGPDSHETLRKDAEDSVYYTVTGELSSRRGGGPFKSQQDRSECLNALGQINPIEVYELRIFQEKGFYAFLLRLWDEFQEEFKGTGLFKMVPLRSLKLDDEIQNVIFAPEPPSTRSRNPDVSILPALRENQRLDPSTPAMIYGSLPEKSIAFFKGKNSKDDEGYFCFPYPY